MNRSTRLLAVVLFTAIVPLRAQLPAAPDSAAERLALGRKLFEGKGLCFSCHGKAGEGMLGPSTRLAGRPLVHIKPVIEQVAGLIKAGVDSAHSSIGQPMPAKGGSRLTDSEVEAVAEYVLQLQKQPIVKKP